MVAVTTTGEVIIHSCFLFLVNQVKKMNGQNIKEKRG
jgi:hypothetical protein